MESPLLRTGFRRAIVACQNPAKRRVTLQPRRYLATPVDLQGGAGGQDEIRAAPEIRFSNNTDQFHQPRAELIANNDTSSRNGRGGRGGAGPRDRGLPQGQDDADLSHLLRRIRILPASPSYFTATPRYTDDFLHLSSLLRKHQILPLLPPGQAPRVAWKTIDQYKTELAEPIRSKSYNMLLLLLKRLNYIHPSLMPEEVTEALKKYKRDVQPHLNIPKPITLNAYGVAKAVGRRKSSSAQVYLVEGTGECLINGKSLTEYFGRLHDRESAIWALKATQRIDKYNVWALASGGGTTGQAEAMTLGVARALMAHEPDLKAALRRAGCVTRDPRRVERKKPGKLKARKMPAWVKR